MSDTPQPEAFDAPTRFGVTPTAESKDVSERPSRSLYWATALVAVTLIVMMAVVAVDLLKGPEAPRTMAELKIATAEAAVKAKPKDFVAHLDLGGAYLEVGKDDDAIREFQTAVKLAPEDYLPYYALANAYVVVGRYDDAVKLFEKAIERVPGNGALYYGLGDLHVKREDYKAAAKALEAAVIVEPTASDSRILLGQVYEELDEDGKALEQYREALKYIPDSQEASSGVARLRGAGGAADKESGD